MPRTRAKAAAAKPVEPVKPAEPEEQVELDEPEETMEEEVEYEEVEEEVEEEEEEEVEEEEEEEVVEEAEEEEETEAANGDPAVASSAGDDGMQVEEGVNDDDAKHAELLALPPHGSEVYLGGVPQDVSEEDIKNFCEPVGEVTEVRLIKAKDSSENKGFAFVIFRTKELAVKAAEDLNDTKLKGKKIKCSASQAKNRLFIGNVPRNWNEDDLRKAVTQACPGLTKLDLMKEPQNSDRNRGFAFAEYYNHACAEYSRRKMSARKFKLDTNTPTVSWADPKNGDSKTGEESTNSEVKSVYVKNLPKNVTQEKVKKLFEHHGEITNVVLPPAKHGQEKQRFGFVHFADRTAAMNAIENTEKYELDGQVLECSLAKPPADRKGDAGSRSKRSSAASTQPSRAAYNNYGAQGYAQPMMYPRAQPPVGMAMIPMVLPDGRLAYVMGGQQPGMAFSPPPRGGIGGRSGYSSGGRSGYSTGSRRSHDNNERRYRPY